MLFEDPSLQLLLMIVCALESLQRSLSTEESYCFSTTFEGWDQLLCYCYCYCYCVVVIVLAPPLRDGISVQMFQISFKGFHFSAAISSIESMINKIGCLILNCQGIHFI